MPQLMPLNWMCFVLMLVLLLFVCYYLYYISIDMKMSVFEVKNMENNLNWVW